MKLSQFRMPLLNKMVKSVLKIMIRPRILLMSKPMMMIAPQPRKMNLDLMMVISSLMM